MQSFPIPMSGRAEEAPADEVARLSLSTQPATRGETRFAWAGVLVSAAVFIVAVPFASVQLAPVPAFIPAYESALVICDLITAALLFSKFRVLRSRALLVLASAYVFTAFIALVHALSFPGAFSPGGLLTGGGETTAWLYMFWHAGFPALVIVYGLAGDSAPPGADSARGVAGSALKVIIACVGAALAAVCALTLAAAGSATYLPLLIVENRFTGSMTAVISAIWLLCFIALAVLWVRRSRSALDLWLLVVMAAWIFDVGLSAVFNDARYDLGWYAGRIYGLVAGGLLLVVLVFENGVQFQRLKLLSAHLAFANEALEQLSLHDSLTGLANRRHFDAYLFDQVAAAQRHGRALALVMCDVDHFKAFNGRHGHPAGDECLKQVAAALRSCCRRPADMAVRYGGEEFALVLPDTELAAAVRVAESARQAVARLRACGVTGELETSVSISGGVAVLPRDAKMSPEALILAADTALFAAKRLGRNRIVQAPIEAGDRAA